MEPKPMVGGERALVTLALALATFMQVLDTSIANVAVPTLSGNLGVSSNQGTWVITSFAVSNAIAVPLTGWLARRFGEVRLFTWAILLFTLASWACGLSVSLPMLIAFRVIQGAVAGPMIPLSQSLLLGIYPENKKGTALALWSMTTLVAPICGPILGGWITDNISWPWIFYINVPVGLFCAFITWQRLRSRETRTVKQPIDGVGLALLVIGVSCLQVLLDKGEELDWFHSDLIVNLAVVSAVTLTILVVWELTDPHPIIDLRLFTHRNFASGTISISMGYMVYFGSVVILPLWLQTQQSYTATWAGLATAPTGVLAVLFSPWVGRNLGRYDVRHLATFSFVVFALCCFWRAGFNTGINFDGIALPQLVQGIGAAFFFVPLVSITLSGLAPDKIASASGLSNFLRILAGSFGASLSQTLWNRRETFHHVQLTEQINAFNPLTRQGLEQIQGLGAGTGQGYATIERLITNQAYMLSTNDVFWLAGWIFVALIPLVWLAKPLPVRSGVVVAAD